MPSGRRGPSVSASRRYGARFADHSTVCIHLLLLPAEPLRSSPIEQLGFQPHDVIPALESKGDRISCFVLEERDDFMIASRFAALSLPIYLGGKHLLFAEVAVSPGRCRACTRVLPPQATGGAPVIWVKSAWLHEPPAETNSSWMWPFAVKKTTCLLPPASHS
jgi:hypothetical protein